MEVVRGFQIHLEPEPRGHTGFWVRAIAVVLWGLTIAWFAPGPQVVVLATWVVVAASFFRGAIWILRSPRTTPLREVAWLLAAVAVLYAAQSGQLLAVLRGRPLLPEWTAASTFVDTGAELLLALSIVLAAVSQELSSSSG